MLSVLFSGVSISMERKKIFFLIPKTDTGKKALLVADLVDSNTYPLDMAIIESWLEKKRNDITQTEPWTAFVDEFVSDINKLVPLFQTYSEKEKILRVRDVIKQVANNLQPGQECSLLARPKY